jgi:polar amino acid transport system substrate-binding protein
MTHTSSRTCKAVRSSVVLVAMASMVALAGCTSTSTPAASGQANEASHLQQVIKRGVLNVGVLPDYPPYSSQQANGDLVGYEPDIAKKLADSLGVKLKMVNTDGTSRKPVLDSNRVDVDIDAFTATDERAKAVEFTIPYVASGALPLFRKDSPIKSIADLKGKKVSVARGSTNDTLMTKQFPDTTVVRFDTIADAIQAVKSKKVDAVMEGFATVSQAAADDPSLAALKIEPISPALISMGVKQGDQIWLNYLNNFIRNLNSSGQNAVIYKKWFNADLPSVIAYQVVK